MGKTKGKKQKGQYEWSGEINRIIPLKNDYCYIQDEKGKLHHLQRNSDEAISLMKSLDQIMEGKISRELESLGWNSILAEVTE